MHVFVVVVVVDVESNEKKNTNVYVQLKKYNGRGVRISRGLMVRYVS